MKYKYLVNFVFFIIAINIISGCASSNNIGVQLFNQGEYDLAAGQWNQAALAGDPYAQHNLGVLWRDGLGSTQRNLHEAAGWFVRSAQQGYVPAMVEAEKIQ